MVYTLWIQWRIDLHVHDGTNCTTFNDELYMEALDDQNFVQYLVDDTERPIRSNHRTWSICSVS